MAPSLWFSPKQLQAERGETSTSEQPATKLSTQARRESGGKSVVSMCSVE